MNDNGLDEAMATLVAEIRDLTPPVEQSGGAEGVAGMGPDVTIPAIWMHLLLTHVDYLSSRNERQEHELRLGLPGRSTPATDDDRTDFATALGHHALVTCEEPEAAAAVMFQGAIAILVKTLPPFAVLATVRSLPEVFELRKKLGIGEVRQ